MANAVYPNQCEVTRITNRESKKLTVPYSIQHDVLGEVKAAKSAYLGVAIDDRLTWNKHVDTVVKKASSTRAFLQQNINRCPRNIKEVCYKTFVPPTVEYAATVWDSSLSIQLPATGRLLNNTYICAMSSEPPSSLAYSGSPNNLT